jgi:CRP/FNR family cyclic AMP-dependent transcriptional regulator
LAHAIFRGSTRIRQGFVAAPQKADSRSPAFDMKSFLDSVGLGKRIGTFQSKKTIFAQGDSAKTVVYIKEGGVKLSVINVTGKEAVVAILGTG